MASLIESACGSGDWTRNWMRHQVLLWLLFVSLSVCVSVSPALAAVSLTDHHQIEKSLDKKGKGSRLSPMGMSPMATGSQALIDNSGLKWFIDTNITFSTSSSASGAMSEASYTHAVAATTLSGGTNASTLNDAFDGYGALCVSFTGATGPCATGNANYVIYNKNGAATTDCNGREVVFPVQTSGNLSFFRKVLIPSNDSFARWLNYFTNTGGAPITFNVITSNNLGSDSNTRIVTSSNGNNTAELTDSWVTTFQNYSGTTSSDPRLGHVLQGAGQNTLTAINFADGDDNPFWTYTVTLNPGETKIIMTYAVGQPSKAAAAAKSADLAALSNPAVCLQCMSAAEESQMANFVAQQKPTAVVPSMNIWGMIIFMLLVGSASFYYLRKKRANS